MVSDYANVQLCGMPAAAAAAACDKRRRCGPDFYSALIARTGHSKHSNAIDSSKSDAAAVVVGRHSFGLYTSLYVNTYRCTMPML